jgi:hypothetical protein
MLSARLAEIVQWLGHLVVAVKTWVRFPVSAAHFGLCLLLFFRVLIVKGVDSILFIMAAL